MPGEKSNLFVILPLIAILAAGGSVPVMTTIPVNSSARITDFSVEIGGVVDFFLQ